MPKANDTNVETDGSPALSRNVMPQTPAPAPNIEPAANAAPTGITLDAPSAGEVASAASLVGREVTPAVGFPPVALPAPPSETSAQDSAPILPVSAQTSPVLAIPVRVANALSVQTPDGVDHPTGSVLDGSVFAEYLRTHYIEKGYLYVLTPPSDEE